MHITREAVPQTRPTYVVEGDILKNIHYGSTAEYWILVRLLAAQTENQQGDTPSLLLGAHHVLLLLVSDSHQCTMLPQRTGGLPSSTHSQLGVAECLLADASNGL